MEDRKSKIEQDLIKYSRLIAKAGFVIGTGGNISAKAGDIVYLKAKDADLAKVGPDDFVGYSLSRNKLISKKPVTHEWRLHIGCFKARADIGAVIHVHPSLVLALPENIKIIKPDYYELKATVKTDIPVIGDLPAGTKELADAVERNIKNHNAVILKNHGIVTVGKDLEEAFVRAQALERMAQVVILRRIQRVA